MSDDSTVIPKEALDWFSSKGLQPGFDYRDVWKEEHSAAFTVAKMTDVDLLSDVQQLLADALADGQPFEVFRDTLKPQLIKKGWWGVQFADDPLTGETKIVQLGSDQRIKTIYNTNMRTARSAGQWNRIDRTKRAMPYLLYQLGPAHQHRKEHVAWENLCLPVDHVFWQTHMTPNGWGCHCNVRQVSKYEYGQLTASGTVTTTAPASKNVKWLNKHTGEYESVPEGIDPGWNYNPGTGRQAQLDKQLAAKQVAFETENKQLKESL
ncbi:hypothetical protein DLC15_05160 [Salmonella enterica subsp. enterica serovar Telelkebir]|nr:hypothetical protein [Salmonella enterica subsp. enterica serovar Telelkebir]